MSVISDVLGELELGIKKESIRERALKNVTKRARQLSDRAQGGEVRLSPDTLGNLEDLSIKSDALIERVRRQNKEFAEERRARSLIPRKERLAQLHRSPRERTVAIMGALERERRLNAALTRASSERAKSTDAIRHSKHKYPEGSLCAWWHNRKVTRKSVMIAKRMRRGPHSRFEERHARKHTKKIIMEALCG